MNRIVLAFVLLTAADVAAQPICPESNITVEIVTDDTPGCATVAPAAGKPELNITNQCGEDQFHIEAGADCPNCGPPLTLRMGTFGAFIVNTQPLTAFSPDSVPTEHELSWARADQTGAMRVRVVPNIILCPEPDMGSPPDMGRDTGAVPEADGEPGGCATVRTGGSWLLLLAFLLARRF